MDEMNNLDEGSTPWMEKQEENTKPFMRSRQLITLLVFVFLFSGLLRAEKMVQVIPEPYTITIKEPVGLPHEAQVIKVPIAPGEDSLFKMQDENTGEWYFIQPSRVHPDTGFLLAGLKPYQEIMLTQPRPASKTDLPFFPVEISHRSALSVIVSNEQFAIDLMHSAGKDTSIRLDDPFPEGPVRRFRIKDGPWRGNTFFDLRYAPLTWNSKVVEEGPIHCLVQYELRFSDTSFYRMNVAVNARQKFARLEEHASTTPGNQLVWDFSGADLPDKMAFVENDPGLRERSLQYQFDEELGRLASWNQFSQLDNFFVGYGFSYENSGDFFGFVTLQGGKWQGNRENHLEAYARRWIHQDKASRRLPAHWKSDGFPGPEKQPPFRGHSRTTEHLNIEGWMGYAKRSYALVLCYQSETYPEQQPVPHYTSRRDPFSLLKRISIQRGIMPLSEMKDMTFEWETEDFSRHAGPNTGLFREDRMEDEYEEIWKNVRNLVSRFWTQNGPAAANPVSSRGVAPRMFAFEQLMRDSAISEEEMRLYRSNASFMINLFYSDHYYPGRASMLPYHHKDSWEPTMKGMANQNFYTDVLNLYGTGGLLFHKHPDAEKFLEKAIRMWDRQLRYHVYPESGVWEESHTYYHHVLKTILPLLIRLREEGRTNFFADANFQNMVRSATRQITPRDYRYYQGQRFIAPLGDHDVDNGYRTVYRVMADEFAPYEPALAGHLAWMYREMGGKKALATTARKVPWQNEWVEGLGYFFKSRDERGMDNLLILRAGSAWGHHHLDDGSIQFYAGGQTLITDAVHSKRIQNGNKLYAKYHSRWTLQDYEPMDYLWRYSRGWIKTYRSEGRFPHAVAYTPEYMAKSTMPRPNHLRGRPFPEPVLFTRTIVRLQENMFLLVDRCKSRLAQETHFHIPHCGEVSLEVGLDARYNDSTRLQIIPLLPRNNKPDTSSLLPTEREVNYRTVHAFKTIHVTFTPGPSPVNAYLIKAGGKTDAMYIDPINRETFKLKDEDSNLLIQIGDDTVELTDQITMANETITLTP